MSIQVFKPLIREESIEAVCKVLRSSWIGLGPKTKEFEQAFVDYLGNDELYASGLNSATSALHLALKLLDISSGANVASPSLTFISTNHAIRYVNLDPTFVDVDKETGNMSPDDLERLLEEDRNDPNYAEDEFLGFIKAIIVVHYSGYPCDMDRINAIAKKYNIPVIEDCAHACGGSYANGKKIGDSENICCFSFQAVKNLPIGDGGMLITNNPEYKKRCDQLRWLGIDKDTYTRKNQTCDYLWKYEVPEVGFKCHMNDINAAIGIEQLKVLDEDNKRRKDIGKCYRSDLSSSLTFMKREHEGSSTHFEPALAEDRDGLIRHLKANDIHPSVHYRRNDLYSTYKETQLPNTGHLEERLITLPIHLLLSDDDVMRVVRVVQEGW